MTTCLILVELVKFTPLAQPVMDNTPDSTQPLSAEIFSKVKKTKNKTIINSSNNVINKVFEPINYF